MTGPTERGPSHTDALPAVREAADWLRQQTPHPSPVVPALRRRFDLSAKQAIDAIRLAASVEPRA